MTLPRMTMHEWRKTRTNVTDFHHLALARMLTVCQASKVVR